ncbi:molybdenum ABC transporter substrate-binding protein [Rhizobium sp. 58]|nr:molybdenum ABC transporter substrate-binding protein [Rhizobium sp. 58]
MRPVRRTFLKSFGAALAGMCLAILPLASNAFAEDKITVFAAASLKNALDMVNAEWQKETGNEAIVSYAASSALAKQVEAGAPADVFISADQAWMDYLAESRRIRQDSRANLLGNQLVLVGASDNMAAVNIRQGFDLATLVGDGKLAMGAVDSVPAGKYGKAALEKLGAWSSVEAKIAGAENVRAALLLVSRGEAPYGIVYRTDAIADPGVRIVGTFPEDSHPAIVYPIAVTADSKSPAAAAYIAFIRSDAAAALFEAQGFTLLK